jgi:lysophospholipase L1-like esterase
MRKSAIWLKVVVINLLILFMIFGSLEVAVRLTAPDYVGAYFMDDVTRGYNIYINNIWRHRVRFDQVDQSLVRQSKPEKRVLFVGDSVIFGYGVDYADTLQEIAAKQLSKNGCSAFLHGVGRINSNLESLLASEQREFILDKFGADLIIYQFNVNDVVDPNGPGMPRVKHLTLRERFEKFRISYLNRSAFIKWAGAYALRQYERAQHRDLRDFAEYSPSSDPVAYARAWKHFEQSLVDTRQLLGQHGIKFAIMAIPESYQVSSSDIDNEYRVNISGIETWPIARLINIARGHGIPVLDVTDALREFRRQHPQVRLYFPSDVNHPNRQGHQVIGQEVARYLLSPQLGICPH